MDVLLAGTQLACIPITLLPLGFTCGAVLREGLGSSVFFHYLHEVVLFTIYIRPCLFTLVSTIYIS